MQAFEVMGTIDEKGQIILDKNLNITTPIRVKVIVLLTNDSDPDDTPIAEIKASLRRSLQQVKAGETRPISELWERIDD